MRNSCVYDFAVSTSDLQVVFLKLTPERRGAVGGARRKYSAALLNRDVGKEEFTDYWGENSLYSRSFFSPIFVWLCFY